MQGIEPERAPALPARQLEVWLEASAASKDKAQPGVCGSGASLASSPCCEVLSLQPAGPKLRLRCLATLQFRFASRMTPLCSCPSGLVRTVAISGLLVVSTACLHRHRARSVQTSPQAPLPTVPPAVPGGHPVPGRTAPAQAPLPSTAPAEIIQGEQGVASWYGHPFHGRSSASGEIYNMYDFTAAHRTLPFGTQVQVHNLQSGESVDVRINDRGPFVEGRIIDLSYAAAEAIHLVGPGIGLVQLQILNPILVAGPTAAPGIFAVQVGAFRQIDNAERLKARIQARFGPVIIQSFDRGNGMFHRVRVGQESTETGARVLANQLQQAGLAQEIFVVRLN
jgi:rare lipoprotein A